MNKLACAKRFASIALVAVAVLLAVVAPSQAQGAAGHGFAGGHPSAGQGLEGRHGFERHRGFERHQPFGAHRDFDRGRRAHFFIGGGYPYSWYYPPVYEYSAPAYWYYCPSYGAYYPDVPSCPEAWVPVPAA